MMNTVLAVIWCLVKLGFIAVSALLLISLIILVLHPIIIDGKARLTERGQKGYIKLSYLFNIIGLEIEASKKSQRVYLRTFCKKKLIHSEGTPKKAKISDKPLKDEINYVDNDNEGISYESTIQSEKINSETSIQNESNDKIFEEKTQIEEKHIDSETNINNAVESKAEEIKIENEVRSDSEVKNVEEENNQEQDIDKKDEDSTIIDIEEQNVPVDNKPVGENENTEQKPETTEPTLDADEHVKIEIPKITAKEEGFFEKIRRLLRKFKSDANRRIDELKGKLRLIRKHWRICKPAIKKFWKRFKGSVEFKDGLLLVRYSLPKPHLTGMLYGALSGLYDLFRRLKTEFVLIPVFNGKSQTFYCKISGRIVLRPFWLLWALFCLLFEFSLYKEYYALYKFLREKKQNKKRSGVK